ncbi:MAX gene-associated protein isoform X3 [Rattus norvegicus]|uniref:MAX gene-associated protein isoform X3 n=1 Tax=Rattus norvegicus TaxID=10116 RepID=UPI0002AB861B|nr:MAX gene-associated protein isoform X3 [Rattus norvegicus]|eukprot:XP_006234862.1 PREDICTED: MAX gene-associated protein isoform X2 [Rattus norvegicus]
MEEKQQIILANQDGGTVTGAAPTFFVILKQPGNGKTDQGILVTNRDARALLSRESSPGKSKEKICLPADCTVGKITVTLDNNSMWNEFHNRSTEMILTKQGRRMFPYCRYWITGLDSNLKYILVMDISPVDSHRYKWNGRWWEPSGKAEPHILGRVFIHPESPSTGHYWMHQPVSFYKLKLTNNTLDQEGHIILHSMHRYLPRLHLVPAEKATEVIQLNGPGVHTFTFPQTEFFAVTAYQNIQITQLKIDYNPFAKGFRDDGLSSKPQRDGKQRNSSDQEGNSVSSSPGHRVRLTEGEGSEIHSGDFDPVLRGHETSSLGLEKAPNNVKQDFLGFMNTDSTHEVPQLKREISESHVSSFEENSQISSPLNPNGNFNVVIKEEPLDDYDYELGECPEGITVKQEETDEETDVYSNSDDDPILEKQLKRHNKVDNLEADHSSYKWLPNSPGVAKAKMFKLDAGKMPVVYLEPCAVTKSTVKISELPDNMLSTSRKDKSMLAELEYLPAYIENSDETGFCLSKDSENSLRKHSSDLRMVQKYTLLKEPHWKYPDIFDSSSTEKTHDSSKGSTEDSFSGKEDLGKKRTTMLKMAIPSKTVNASQSASPNTPGKRGRPRKLRLSKAGRPPKNTGKSLTASKNIPVGPGNTFPDVKPDLEDVDGVLFVSFESKEALDIHAVDGTTEEPSSVQTTTTNDSGSRTRISQLEKELIEDLKSLRHKQVIHPALQEVGLKLNSVDPTMSIDLKYLGVQLPLAPATSFPLWNVTGTNPASPDAGFPFVSRTGKTNDFTKIKGWRGKFHNASASRNEGGNSETSLKNRSAFCSDKLDEYLENEGKLMETSMGFSSNAPTAPTSPVVYQLPTKSTSYVRTLDSVLKKQSTISPSTSHSVKPHSVTTASRKTKAQNKQTTVSGRTKSSYKSILPYPVSPKQKNSHVSPGDKITKNSLSSASDNQVTNLVVPSIDESAFPKQISLRQAQQQHIQQQGTRPPGLSKSQVKLMDLEDCALWEGKPRTYITEERADVSLTTLLTAQASLKTKPIHTIIRKRAPPCNNDFCRLGCVCSSLALEKRQPAHCRRPDCMFGCTCLKRKVVLVKGGSKTKHLHKKAANRDPLFYDTLGEGGREGGGGVREDEEQLKEKKKRKKLEYTVCEAEPEQPVRHYPLWVKVDGEVDPEPVYIPTPSVIEPIKPLVLPQPDASSTTIKGKLTPGIKPTRAYTPKPNPVIREEDKDPVYLYFESMMTCARVRVYERKKDEQRQLSPPLSPSSSFQQQSSCYSSPENHATKELDSEQTLKQLICDLEDDSDKSQEKTWKSSCNEGESSSTSYVHQRSPGGPTKLIEIISDCNWEEDRNKILSILSQHINSNMPQSLKVGSFIIELASQRKCRGEKTPPVYSSRVKISMPSSQDQDDMAEKSGSETPDGPLSPGKMDDISPVQTDALDSVRERLHGGKGLPFYAGLSPSGKLVAYKRKPSSTTSGLIQVASNAKVAASRKPRTLLPSTSNSKMASSGPTTNRSGKNLKAFVPAKRPIAARPSPGGVFTQFVMSKVGALQQKIPGVRTPQPLTGPQKFSIRPSPVMVVAPVVSSEQVQVCSTVTAAVTTSPQVVLENVTAVPSLTANSDMGAKEATYSSSASTAGVVEISETNNTTPVTSTQSTATVNLTKTTGITTSPVASVSFPKPLVASPTITLPVASTASTSIVMVTTAASSSVVTTPTSSLSSVPIILSGINGSPPVSQRPENAPQIPVTTPQISPNNVKRTGPRLLLIPVQQGSPTLRPIPNPQLQGQRMVLQPVRSPSGMNLFRHPNGQIVQLLPLHQIRGSNTQPSLQPVVFRNPGSVVGIRLPTPCKSSETPSSSSSSAFSVMSPVIQAVGSSPTVNVISQAPSLLSSGSSFVSQAGTLTLRISPPETQNLASKTASESKITPSTGGQPVGTASLIPLQSGSFALLQLPGQKPVPNSVLQHVASLQIKKESQNTDQKDESNSIKREKETKKALSSKDEVVDPEANIMKQNSGIIASEDTFNNSLDDRGDLLDEESLREDTRPYEYSYSTGSHTDEDKDGDEESGNKNENSPKEKQTVPEVRAGSENINIMTLQNVRKVRPQKYVEVKVEQQQGSENPDDFLVLSKEESKFELSGSQVKEQKSNSQTEAKKDCEDSLGKDSLRERWRKHLKGPLTHKYVGISQDFKKEADVQLFTEMKPCQDNSERDISELLGKSGTIESGGIFKTEDGSWSGISSSAAFSIIPRRATKGRRGSRRFQGHFLLSKEHMKPKQQANGGRSSADFTVLDLEDEDEEDENEKTDDSIDEIVDVVSGYQSEEVDVEKNNYVDYIEDDEQVDVETVEELSEEINFTYKKTTAAHTQSFRQQCHSLISADEKASEKSRKVSLISSKLKDDCWSDKPHKETEAFAYYRRTHTANERRRRGEMRDLFEKLKITLGLLHSSKVSKSLILNRAFSEIQGLTDQADKLIGQKNLLSRKRSILIRKVSSLSGKTEEVVLKKLEYIYAKQQALEAQKRKKKMGSDEFGLSPRISTQLEGSSSSVDLGQMFMSNRRGKPLILSRRRDQATENASPSDTPHSSANLVMTPQGQLLTLKGPLFSAPVVAVSPALLEAGLKPQVASSTMAQSENDDLFMMPRIVNVTSLAAEEDLGGMSGNKYLHEVPDGKPALDHLRDVSGNEASSLKDTERISSRGNHRDSRMALGPTQVFLANKDSGFPHVPDVSTMQAAQEFIPKKMSGDLRGHRHKWKECELRGERLKSKESQFHKLKMKDLKDSSIEMELRKVASAIEEAALDPSELLTNMEDEDDTDETLTSLLNEIAFLNQQLNDDSGLAELSGSLDTEFPGDAQQAFISKLAPGNRSAFQVGHLGTGVKELPDVQEESESISPLLLHLEDDDFSENEKQLGDTASEPDVLKIVIDSEIKDSLVSHRKSSDGGQSTSGLPAEPESVSSPPILHMKTGPENSSTDTLWRPMPKLAPLGLKVANPPSDADGQSLKVMPALAPIAAKVGSVGHKMNTTGSDQEGRGSKMMPTLAPVVTKLGNSGVPSSSSGK